MNNSNILSFFCFTMAFYFSMQINYQPAAGVPTNKPVVPQQTITTEKIDAEKLIIIQAIAATREKVELAKQKRAADKKLIQSINREYEAKGPCFAGATESWDWGFRATYDRHSKKIGQSIKSVSLVKKQVTVAVIDTGIDYRNTFLKAAIPSKYSMKKLNFTNGADHDRHGHGTHVAGIILGVMPQAKVLPLKIFDTRITQKMEHLHKALRFAIDQKVDVINLSLEGEDRDPKEEKLLKEAAKKGIIIISAAGNSNLNLANKSAFPASYKSFNQIVVGNAHYKEDEDKAADSSNYGNQVDFFIRGTSVTSLGLDCNLDRMSGTSQATPAISGIVAYFKAKYPKMKLSQIKNHLAKVSKKPEFHELSKFGYLQLSEALLLEIEEPKEEIPPSRSVSSQK